MTASRTLRRCPIIVASTPPSLRAQRSNPGATARGPWIALSQGLLAMTVNGGVRVPQVDFLISGLHLSMGPFGELLHLGEGHREPRGRDIGNRPRQETALSCPSPSATVARSSEPESRLKTPRFSTQTEVANISTHAVIGGIHGPLARKRRATALVSTWVLSALVLSFMVGMSQVHADSPSLA